MEVIMSYDEIMEYINNGYAPLWDLSMLLELGYINNNDNKKYRMYVAQDGWIDVYGGNVIEEYIPAHMSFGRFVEKQVRYYPLDRDFIYEE